MAAMKDIFLQELCEPGSLVQILLLLPSCLVIGTPTHVVILLTPPSSRNASRFLSEPGRIQI